MTTIPDPSQREPRSNVMLTALLFHREGEAAVSHRVVNLSASGVCIAQGDALAPGQRVIVTIGLVAHVAAEVAWVRGGLAGLRFDASIALEAARKRRAGSGELPPAAGWMAELHSPYRAAGDAPARRASDARPLVATRFTAR